MIGLLGDIHNRLVDLFLSYLNAYEKRCMYRQMKVIELLLGA